MAKAGRPRIPIDREEFEKLCNLQCTKVEIAGFFNCSDDTIEKFCRREYNMTFTEIFRIKSAGGKISLRRNMFRMSESNATVAIWLSKQHLGMKEKVETENTNTNKNVDLSHLSTEELKDLINNED